MISVLAIDPGVVNLGWCVMTTEYKTCVVVADLFTCKSDCELFNEKMNEESFQCLLHFESIIDQFGITHVAWELPPGFGGMGQQSRILSNIHSLKALVWQRGLYFDFFHPSQMKRLFTGDGTSDKEAVKREVIRRYPAFDDTHLPKKEQTQFDVFDAIGIGSVAIERRQWKKYERQ